MGFFGGQTRQDPATTPSFEEDTFEEAFQACVEQAKEGDAVLLSPACASWGMFPNYEVRGKVFKELVRKMS